MFSFVEQQQRVKEKKKKNFYKIEFGHDKKSPKNVVYSEGNFFGSTAAPIILIAVPQNRHAVFPFLNL